MTEIRREISDLPVIKRKRKSLQIKYTGRNFSREEVVLRAQALSDALERRGRGLISVLLPFGTNNETKWRPGKFTNFGDPVDLFNPDEYDGDPVEEPPYFGAILFYILPETDIGLRAGGYGYRNDCFYNAMISIYPKINKVYLTPESLKEEIGIERDDLVPLDKMSRIESKLPPHIKISISGDHVYTSTRGNGVVLDVEILPFGLDVLTSMDCYEERIEEDDGVDAYMTPIFF
ncbi:hypothetical protein DFA_04527 [Cavenderia fasciculata]|uniref:Uncharacterized protein n=1 Tax=Cavenderia fasciculata TaxID=261658 RepID=F4PPU4_CACFS|nr:uncharacterized protein DFA_04527 [Cavenderia fasciculata]EGG22407.1 hypothetical protein DFA_04527 [Cavenderia fasciculata]|eukprot:XP_004360258.1 hypothetical protein DFA_04527 [Cavenderia fasciculata]